MIISRTEFSYMVPRALADEEGLDAWFTLKNPHYTSADSQIEGLNTGYNTRDPESAVTRNRSRLFSELGIDSEWVALADQVHGSSIRVVSEGGTYSSTDGLITTIPGLALAIQVADCAAVLLWDASNHIVGAFHAGWRGAAAGIIPKGIQMMKHRGAEAGSLKAFVSPCISLQNFEVGPEVSALFPSSFIDEDHFQRPHVDLKGFIKSQLREQGIPASNIEVRGECTVDDRDSYYSFRREGAESGRMMALIRLKR